MLLGERISFFPPEATAHVSNSELLSCIRLFTVRNLRVIAPYVSILTSVVWLYNFLGLRS